MHAQLDPFRQKLVDEDECRRLANVIGPGLEGQAPDGQRLIFEIRPEMFADLLKENALLGFIDPIDGFQQKPKPDYPPGEFFIGGKIVKDMTDDTHDLLKEAGVTLDRDPQRLLESVAGKFLVGK